MSVARAVFARLTDADSGVPAVCPSVFAQDAEEGSAIPRIVYEVTDSELDRTYQGSTGLLNTSVEVQVIAETYKSAGEIGKAVRDALEGRGEWGGVTVKGSFYRSGSEDYSTPAVGLPGTYSRTLQFEIWVQD